MCGLLVASCATSCVTRLPREQEATSRLAILVAAPRPDERAMANDLSAMAAALRRRGLDEPQILRLADPEDPAQLLALLDAALADAAEWTRGTVFLHFSGHGDVSGTRLDDAVPVIALAAGDAGARVQWDSILQRLARLPHIRFALVPDC
jgi:hypothetical protein